jgi:hypothetical protein
MTSHPAYIVEWSAPRLTADFVRCPTERGLTGLWTRCGANLLRIVTLNDQLDMITGKGPSARHEVSYFAESDPAAVRIDDFKYQFIHAGGRMARHRGASRLTDSRQLTLGSFRTHRHAGEWESTWVAGVLRLVGWIELSRRLSAPADWGDAEQRTDRRQREPVRCTPCVRLHRDRGQHRAFRP